MTRDNLPRIERGTTRIIVPHEAGEIAFIHPSQGPHNYQTVGRGLKARNLELPNGDYTASLIHASYCSGVQAPEFQEVRDTMKNKWIWVFNRNLWTPNGLYVVSDPEAKGLSEKLDTKVLERKLKGAKELSWGGIRFSKDGSVRFAPKDSYDLGEHKPEELAKQGDVVASYGIKGAEKLGEVASKFKYKPMTFGVNVNEGENSEQRVASLDSTWNIDDGGLYVYGNDWDGSYYGGFAFGVSK